MDSGIGVERVEVPMAESATFADCISALILAVSANSNQKFCIVSACVTFSVLIPQLMFQLRSATDLQK